MSSVQSDKAIRQKPHDESIKQASEDFQRVPRNYQRVQQSSDPNSGSINKIAMITPQRRDLSEYKSRPIDSPKHEYQGTATDINESGITSAIGGSELNSELGRFQKRSFSVSS